MFGSTKVKIEVSPSAGIQLHEKATFDFHKLYKFMQEWLVSKKYEFYEKENTHKDTRSGTEIIMQFVGEREIDDYVKYEIKVLMRIYDMEKVTVETKEGKKKLDMGMMYINIKATAIIDYMGIWGKTKFNRFLGYMYNNYIIKRKINERYLGNLYGEMMGFYTGVKEQLDLYR